MPAHCPPPRTSLMPALALAALAALTGGCQRATVERPLAWAHGGAAPARQMEFWHNLPEQAVTSNDSAFHGILLFFEPDEPVPGTYSKRVGRLQTLGWLPADFDRPATEAVTRGTLAVILAGALEIRGGLMMRLLGPTERYALRELIHLGLFPESSPNQAVSGTAYMALIGRTEDYLRRREPREG